MADITKCKGEHFKICPIRDKCYRYTALSSELQSYFLVAPFNLNDQCDKFMKTEDNYIKINKPEKSIKVTAASKSKRPKKLKLRSMS